MIIFSFFLLTIIIFVLYYYYQQQKQKGDYMKKSSKYAIGAVIIAGFLLIGPKFYNTIKCAKKNREHAQIEKQITDKRAEQEQDAQYEEYIIDSVLNANGFNRYDGYDFRMEITDLDNQINELNWQQTAGGAMEKAVFSSGEKIVKRYMNAINQDVAKYGLEILNFDILTEEMCQNPEIIMNGAYKDAGIEDEYGEYDISDFASEVIVPNIDFGNYGEPRQQEIIKTVNDHFAQMLNELYANRKHIERTFADYFAGGQATINETSVVYCGEGTYSAGYARYNITYRNTTRSVSVYDSKLPVSFFGDSDAIYKLHQVSPGKWYVSKQYANGKIEKTAVFQDKVDYSTYTYTSNEKGKSEFSFVPGVNMGVRIKVCEVTDVQTAKKQFKGPSFARQIDSLNVRKDSLVRKDKEYKKAQRLAHSVAQQKLQQRINQRTRVK
jgi:hypothetical protein